MRRHLPFLFPGTTHKIRKTLWNSILTLFRDQYMILDTADTSSGEAVMSAPAIYILL